MMRCCRVQECRDPTNKDVDQDVGGKSDSNLRAVAKEKYIVPWHGIAFNIWILSGTGVLQKM